MEPPLKLVAIVTTELVSVMEPDALLSNNRFLSRQGFRLIQAGSWGRRSRFFSKALPVLVVNLLVREDFRSWIRSTMQREVSLEEGELAS